LIESLFYQGMNLKLFGPRVLLKYEKPKAAGRIVLPDMVGQHDLHRLGRVEVIGDGRTRDPYTGQKITVPSLVKRGDLVVFQINDVMKWAQIYRHLDTDMIHVLQSELIARINGDIVTTETLEMLGDYVLVKPQLRKSKSSILLPDTKSLDFVYYELVQKGSTVELPIEIGEEVIINHGRINALFVQGEINGRTQSLEFGYVFKDYIHGVVEGPESVSLKA
jgi:co-chaperonin GroES (HSP10)